MPEPAKCRSCGADVYFVPSAKTGKLMILDAEPVPAGNITINAEGRAAVFGRTMFDNIPAAQPRYKDHHASCPEADSWRKSKVKDS